MSHGMRAKAGKPKDAKAIQRTPLQIAEMIAYAVTKCDIKIMRRDDAKRIKSGDNTMRERLWVNGLSKHFDSNGLGKFKDTDQQIQAMLDIANTSRVYQRMNCVAACALVIHYMVSYKIEIPLTQFRLQNYDHTFMVFGLNKTEENLEELDFHLLDEKTYGATINNVVIVDLWNEKKPVQTFAEFQVNMRGLLKRENLKSLDEKDDSLAVKTVLHIPRPAAIKLPSQCENLTKFGIFAVVAAAAVKYVVPAVIAYMNANSNKPT